MATSAARMRALRERRRRGFHKLTIQVSEHDLRQIAQAGYEGAQAPTTISRRKRLACSSPTRFLQI